MENDNPTSLQSHSQEKQLQQAINDANADINLDNPDLEIHREVEVNAAEPDVIEFEIVQPIPASHPTDPAPCTYTGTLPDGSYYSLTVRKNKRCPNCSFYPSYPPEYYLENGEKLPELKGTCRKCGNKICTNCKRVTDCCEFTLCNGCTDSYADKGDVLCYRHREDVVQERQVEHAKEFREMQLEEERMHLEQETIREVKAKKFEIEERRLDLEEELRNRRMDLQERIQDHQEYIDDLRAEFKHEEVMYEFELEERRLELQEELDRRRQQLDEFETAAGLLLEKQSLDVKQEHNQEKIDLERDKMELDHEFREEKLDFEKQKHRDTIDIDRRKQDIEEREKFFRAKIREEEHELDKIQRILDMSDRHDIPPEELHKKLSRATLEMSQLDNSWMPQQITV